MVPKNLYHAPMGTEMRSNNIIMHFCVPDDILRASCQRGIALGPDLVRLNGHPQSAVKFNPLPAGSDLAGLGLGRSAQAQRPGWPAVWGAPNHKKSTPDHKNINRPDGPKILVSRSDEHEGAFKQHHYAILRTQ